MRRKMISIIIPCYNEEENIIPMYERIIKVFKKIKYNAEIIFIDNDSTDDSKKIFEKLAKKDKKVTVIIMSRNFGSPQPSFIAGLDNMRGEAAVLLHGDIQDPPEMIPQFVKKWEEGYDVVYGIRPKRKGYNFLYNLFYRGFYYILQKLAYIDIPLDAGEFSLIDKKVIRELLKIDEYDYYLRCLRAFVGFKQTGIKYVRDPRIHGKSTESLSSGFWWAKTVIINFSFKPLEWISKIAFTVMFISFVLLIINVVLLFIDKSTPRGMPTTILSVLFLGGVQLLCLSIIAEYIAKIFLEVKRRPRYIIKKILNKDKSPDQR